MAANTLGSPLQSLNVPVFGLAPLRTAKPFNSQFVAKSKPFWTLKGKPLVHFASPDNDQPPRAASNPRFQLAPHFLPRPAGNSYTQLVFSWWVVSEADTARSCPGWNALIIWLPKPKPSNNETRSELEPKSMDFEYV